MLKISDFFKKELIEAFPENFDRLLVTAMLRVLYRCPLKNLDVHYQQTYLSEVLPNCSLKRSIDDLILAGNRKPEG